MWSIAVETQIYLLFPMMLWLSRGISIYANLLLTGVLGYCLFEKFGLWQGFERDTHYLFIFALGMYAAWFSRRASALAVRVVTAVALCSSASAVFLMWLWSFSDFEVVDFFVGISACCVLIIGAARPQGQTAKLLSHPWLLSIGAFSYSLYLLHKPVQIAMNTLIQNWQLRPSELFAFRATVGTALALGFSYAFYLCFEKPFLQRTARGSLVVNHKDQFLSHTPEAQTLPQYR